VAGQRANAVDPVTRRRGHSDSDLRGIALSRECCAVGSQARVTDSGTLRVPRCGFLSPRLGELREDLVQLVEVERMLPCLADTTTSDVKDERHCALDGLASSRRGNTVQTNHSVIIGQQIL